MTKQPLYLTIGYIYRQNSIYKLIHQRSVQCLNAVSFSSFLVLMNNVVLSYGVPRKQLRVSLYFAYKHLLGVRLDRI